MYEACQDFVAHMLATLWNESGVITLQQLRYTQVLPRLAQQTNVLGQDDSESVLPVGLWHSYMSKLLCALFLRSSCNTPY